MIKLFDILRFKEFKKLHPSFRGTEKDLWEKYHIHINQCEENQRLTSLKDNPIIEIKEELNTPVSSQFSNLNPKILNYIKSVIESNKIYIPTRSARLGQDLLTMSKARPTARDPIETAKGVADPTLKATADKVVPIPSNLQVNQVQPWIRF